MSVRLQCVDVVVVGAEDDVEPACSGDVTDGRRRKDGVGVVVGGGPSPRVERAPGLEDEPYPSTRVEGFEPALLVSPPERAGTHDDRGRPVRAVEIRDGRARVDGRRRRAVDVHPLGPTRQLTTPTSR